MVKSENSNLKPNINETISNATSNTTQTTSDPSFGRLIKASLQRVVEFPDFVWRNDPILYHTFKTFLFAICSNYIENIIPSPDEKHEICFWLFSILSHCDISLTDPKSSDNSYNKDEIKTINKQLLKTTNQSIEPMNPKFNKRAENSGMDNLMMAEPNDPPKHLSQNSILDKELNFSSLKDLELGLTHLNDEIRLLKQKTGKYVIKRQLIIDAMDKKFNETDL